MHRSSLTSGNKVYQKRIIEQEQQRMEKRVRSAQAQVDTSTPSTFDHTHSGVNKKKYQLQEQQNTEIERENRILLEKITRVMRESSAPKRNNRIQTSPPNDLLEAPGSGASSMASIQSTMTSNIPTPAKRSLNASIRRKDQEKIMAENQNLLRRLQNKKSDYQSKKPPIDSNSYRTIDALAPLPPSSSQSVRSRSSAQQRGLHESRSLPRAATQRTTLTEESISTLDSHKRSGSGYLHDKQQSQQQQPLASKHVLFRKTKKVGSAMYLFEISLENNMLRITADDTTAKVGGVQKVMEMSEQDGFTLLATRFEHSLDLLFDSLTITDRITIAGLQVHLQQTEQQQQYHVNLPKPTHSLSLPRMYAHPFAANYSEIIEQPDLELSASNLFPNKKKLETCKPPLPLNQRSQQMNRNDTAGGENYGDDDFDDGMGAASASQYDDHEITDHILANEMIFKQDQGKHEKDEQKEKPILKHEEEERYSDDVFDEYSEDHYDNDESLKIKEIQEEKRHNTQQGDINNHNEEDEDEAEKYEDDCEFLEDQETVLDLNN